MARKIFSYPNTVCVHTKFLLVFLWFCVLHLNIKTSRLYSAWGWAPTLLLSTKMSNYCGTTYWRLHPFLSYLNWSNFYIHLFPSSPSLNFKKYRKLPEGKKTQLTMSRHRINCLTQLVLFPLSMTNSGLLTTFGLSMENGGCPVILIFCKSYKSYSFF